MNLTNMLIPGCLILFYPGNLVTRKLSDVTETQAPPHIKFYMAKTKNPLSCNIEHAASQRRSHFCAMVF